MFLSVLNHHGHSETFFLRGLVPTPFWLLEIYPKERKAIKDEISKEKYDLIHAETFYVMPHIPDTDTPILLVEQTIEYLVYKHYVESIKNIFVRLLLSIDVAKLKFWETNFWRKADGVVAVSDTDKSEMIKLVHKLDVGLVPNGVNLDFFKVKSDWSDENPRVLFVANFKWLQNVEAAELLIDKIFPIIHRKYPLSKAWIVGQHVPKEIIARRTKDILIDNLEEKDQEGIRRAYFEASVFVSSLRGPGGTRLKHFAAMAAKLPLVTTKVGAEGLGTIDGTQILVRDDPEGLAEAAIEILRDSNKAKALANNARKLVEEKYSWYKMSEYLDVIYEKTAHGN